MRTKGDHRAVGNTRPCVGSVDREGPQEPPWQGSQLQRQLWTWKWVPWPEP